MSGFFIHASAYLSRFFCCIYRKLVLPMKKIIVLHTGGTISMSENKETGEVSPEAEHPLKNMARELGLNALIEEHVIFDLPSPQMTPSHMLTLAKEISRLEQKADGFVITHGTDTLEETAYFLDLVLGLKKPVVLTGAMRSSNELGSDALFNLQSALKTALDETSWDQGVLVVMNGEIHGAREVVKTSSISLDAFKSTYGPLGHVLRDQVIYHKKLARTQPLRTASLSKHVHLLKVYAGMDSSLLDAVRQTNPDGLILEAFGQGNVPENLVPALARYLDAGIPIILASRCLHSFVLPTYSYPGGGRQLKDMGLIFASGLSGPKARLKLMLLLETANSIAELQAGFTH